MKSNVAKITLTLGYMLHEPGYSPHRPSSPRSKSSLEPDLTSFLRSKLALQKALNDGIVKIKSLVSLERRLFGMVYFRAFDSVDGLLLVSGAGAFFPTIKYHIS